MQACCLAILQYNHQELTSTRLVHHTADAAQLHTHARTVPQLIPAHASGSALSTTTLVMIGPSPVREVLISLPFSLLRQLHVDPEQAVLFRRQPQAIPAAVMSQHINILSAVVVSVDQAGCMSCFYSRDLKHLAVSRAYLVLNFGRGLLLRASANCRSTCMQRSILRGMASSSMSWNS